jgi:hypothetical protein
MGTAPSFTHTHASGRFTATPGQVEAAIDDYMANSDLVTVTEVDANIRARCLNEKGWHAVFGDKGPRDDCGLAVRDTAFALVKGGTETLSPLRYMTEAGHLSDTTDGAYAVLRHRNAKTVGVVVVVHMPHGMQEELRKNRITSDVAKAYRDILRGARRLANRLARQFSATWTMIVGDMNLNIKKSWVQAYLKQNFPNYQVNFTKPYPPRGTFMASIIDLALLRGIKVRGRPVILFRKAGFDHVGWRQILTGWA